MPDVLLITTHDGSHTLLNTALNETYHSVHGALQESKHVFIQHGLDFISKDKLAIHILEVGFGTGLNALLTMQRANAENLLVYYTTLEAFPVEEDIWTKLNYVDSAEAKEQFEKLHRAKWNEAENVSSNFVLRKLHTTLQQVELESSHYDLIYFDAFAPSKQPEMWEIRMLKKVVNAIKPVGVFVTYCAKGQLKRDLQSLHMEVESLPGPPGKREMVRAKKSKVS